jgi:citrate lyase synthetase
MEKKISIFFSIFLYLFVIKKISQQKALPVKEKFNLISRNYKKFRNIILFTNYNKFSPQTFDCYIFCFDFFLISPLRI